MIRYSSSFFISLVIHLVLALIVYAIYTFYILNKPQKQTVEKRVQIQLSTLQIKTNVQKQVKKIETTISKPPLIKTVTPVEIPKPKKIEKKIVKKILKVEKIKTILKDTQKEITPIKKKVPLPVKAIKTVVPQIKLVEEKQENNIPEKEVIIVKESPQMKNTRLEKEYLDEHIKKITQLLSENLYYPRSARKRGIVGIVLVKFKLSIEAKVHSIEVIQSNSPILSRAAITTIKELSTQFPSPLEELVLHVPINYHLSK